MAKIAQSAVGLVTDAAVGAVGAVAMAAEAVGLTSKKEEDGSSS